MRGTPISAANPQRRRSHESDCSVRALAAAFLTRNSMAVIDTPFRQNDRHRSSIVLTERDADAGDDYATWSMVDLCREALRIDRREVPINRDEMIRAAVSTSSLSAIFSTSIHNRLLMGFLETDDSTDWCSEEDVSNFQEQERSSLGKTGDLEKLKSEVKRS